MPLGGNVGPTATGAGPSEGGVARSDLLEVLIFDWDQSNEGLVQGFQGFFLGKEGLVQR